MFFGAFAFVGAFLAAFGAGGLLFAATVRVLVRRLGERGLAAAGGALICLGFLALAAASAPAFVPFAVGLVGLGFYMLHNTLQTNATQMAPEARGLAVSAFASCFFLGQAAGAWLAGTIADRAGFPVLFLAAGPLVLLLALGFARALDWRPAST